LLGLVHLFETVDFPPHLCALVLHAVNFAVQVCGLCAEVSHLVSLGDSFVSQTTSFKEFLIQQALGTLHFVV